MDLSNLSVSFLAGTLGQGGAEQQLFYILRALRQSKATLRVLSLGQNEFWQDRIENLGVPVTYVGHSPSKLTRLFRIMTELRKCPPDVFQSQHFYTSAYVGTAARLFRLYGIGALRSNGVSELSANGFIGGRLSLRAPNLIAANSQTAIRFATDCGILPERLHFLPNVVDTERYKPAVAGNGHDIRLISVGRLIACKRFDRFLSVLALLRKSLNTTIKGIIVGEGPLRLQLEQHAQALGLLSDVVEFKGGVASMAPVYQKADICVLTSDYEGTPNVLLEAMACGLPIVATRVGGVPEVIREGENGLMVEPDDEASLYAALVSLTNDSRLRKQMGSKARAYAQTNHALDRLPTTLQGLYRLALS
jgi:glycosyltransferase involved in cell wall biosynthesis